jgi:hypothetical protein
MKVRAQVTVYEGYSDKLTGRLFETVELEYDLLAVPRTGDYIETGYGDLMVERAFWSMGGEVTLRLQPIYTLDESQETVLAHLLGDTPEDR